MTKIKTFFVLCLSAFFMIFASCSSQLAENTGISFEIPVEAIAEALTSRESSRESGNSTADLTESHFLITAKLIDSEGNITKQEKRFTFNDLMPHKRMNVANVSFDFPNQPVNRTYSLVVYISNAHLYTTEMPIFYGKTDNIVLTRNKTTPVTVLISSCEDFNELAGDTWLETSLNEMESCNPEEAKFVYYRDFMDEEPFYLKSLPGKTNFAFCGAKFNNPKISLFVNDTEITDYKNNNENGFRYEFTVDISKPEIYTIKAVFTDTEKQFDVTYSYVFSFENYKYELDSNYLIYNHTGSTVITSSTYDFYDMDDAKLAMSNYKFAAKQTAFDYNGNVWYIDAESSAVTIRDYINSSSYPKIRAFNSGDGSGYTPKAIAIDAVSNKMAVLGSNGDTTSAIAVYNLHGIELFSTDSLTPEEVYYADIEDSSVRKINLDYIPMAFVNNSVYMGYSYSKNNDRFETIKKISLNGQGSTAIATVSSEKDLNSLFTDLSQNNKFRLNDLVFHKGYLYALVADVDLAYNGNPVLKSWGAVIRMNSDFSNVKITGVPKTTSESVLAPYYYTSNGIDKKINYVVGRDTPVSKISYTSKIPGQYENALNYPHRFIAIKPKVLVISDDGNFLYCDNDGNYKIKGNSKVATINLENFTVQDRVDSNVDYTQDAKADNLITLRGTDTITAEAQSLYYLAPDGEVPSGGEMFPMVIIEQE